MNIDTTILHLSLIDGFGPAKIKQIFDFKPKEFELTDLYSMLPSDLINLFGFTPEIAKKIVHGLADRTLLEKELALLEKNSISWITSADDAYPPLLKAIHIPPEVLYYRGAALPSLADDHAKVIAIVGARQANNYGQRVVNQIVPPLVAQDWTIVSGGALGIDTMAHRATVDAGGRTIAVLGSGLLRPYPQSNWRLFDDIVDSGGTLVSSFSVQTEPLPGNFPARNRIIAGLSRGCIVVQAAVKSGARITAQCALDQSREVFAIPGPIDDPLSAGCNALIQEGAKLTTCIEDVFAEFEFEYPAIYPVVVANKEGVKKTHRQTTISESKQVSAPKYDPASPEGIILNLLAMGAASVDELVNETGLNLTSLNAKLFDLQIAGFIAQNFVGQWELVR